MQLKVLNNTSHCDSSSAAPPCSSPEAGAENDYFRLEEKHNKKKEMFIVVESGRCSWARCSFCSFSKKPAELIPQKTTDEIKKEIDFKLRKVQKNSLDFLKFFNSGSFLDGNQIPQEAQKYLIDTCVSLGIKNLLVESTNEWVKEEYLQKLKEWASDKIQIWFGFGFETFDDAVRKKIAKIGTAADYIRAAELVKMHGFKVRFYVMVGLPFVSNYQADLENTIKNTYGLVDAYAIINTFPYGYSVMFDWYMQGKWAPLTVDEFSKIVLPVKKKLDKSGKMELYADDYVTYPKFPEYRQKLAIRSMLKGAKTENLDNGFYNVWQDYFQRFYAVPEGKDYALFLPCAFQKPYAKSKTHKAILGRLQGLKEYHKIHQVMISNPGVIPREFETKWPLADYDWPEWEETKELKQEYTTITGMRIEKYLKNHKYKKVFCFFKEGSESLAALRQACAKLKINLVEGMAPGESDLLSRKNLDCLARVLRANI